MTIVGSREEHAWLYITELWKPARVEPLPPLWVNCCRLHCPLRGEPACLTCFLGEVGNLFDWKSTVITGFQPQYICAWILKRCKTTLFLLLALFRLACAESVMCQCHFNVCLHYSRSVCWWEAKWQGTEHQLMPCFSSSRSFPAFCPSSNNRHSVRDSFLLEIKSLLQPST